MLFDKIKRKLRSFKKRQEKINLVSKKSGWSKSQAKKALDKARAIGMPDYRYIKNECWNLSDDEILELNESIVKRLEEKQAESELIEGLVEKSGLSSKLIAEKLKVSRSFEIKDTVFEKKQLWDLSDSELEEYSKASNKLKARRKKINKFYLDVVCEKSGWDKKKAKSEMAAARKKGISNAKYVQRGIWTKNESEIDSIAEYLEKYKAKISSDAHLYFESVKEKMGWSHGKTELEFIKIKANCGASDEDIALFRLYEKTPKQQRKYATHAMFEMMRIKYNSTVESWSDFSDKAKFNSNFADLIERKWFVNKKLSYDEFISKIEGLDRLIIKPLSATQGKGIEVVNCNVSDEDNKAVYDYIMSLKKSIVEEYVIQHKEMSKFSSSTVNTVRVLTLNFNGECKFLYSVFRMGKDGVVDNFHAGGVAAGVDVKTGVVCTNAVNLDGDIFTHSPATNELIKGFQIPNWDKIVEICKKASVRIETTRLVGWDFAVTEKGAELIEGNQSGSYIVAQLPFVEDDIGLYEDMVAPYLPEFTEIFKYKKK